MCNLYSVTKGQQAIRELSGAMRDKANFSASGLKRQDNDLIVIESPGAAASFKRNFEARYASGEALATAKQ